MERLGVAHHSLYRPIYEQRDGKYVMRDGKLVVAGTQKTAEATHLFRTDHFDILVHQQMNGMVHQYMEAHPGYVVKIWDTPDLAKVQLLMQQLFPGYFVTIVTAENTSMKDFTKLDETPMYQIGETMREREFFTHDRRILSRDTKDPNRILKGGFIASGGGRLLIGIMNKHKWISHHENFQKCLELAQNYNPGEFFSKQKVKKQA